jgi:hypothetical protein
MSSHRSKKIAGNVNNNDDIKNKIPVINKKVCNDCDIIELIKTSSLLEKDISGLYGQLLSKVCDDSNIIGLIET